jgi:hypothetical protein
MIKHKVLVDIEIYAKDTFHLNKQVNEYLTQSFREFAAQYNVTDYTVIYDCGSKDGGCPRDYEHLCT